MITTAPQLLITIPLSTMLMRGRRDHMVVDLLMLLITIPLSTMLMRGHRDLNYHMIMTVPH
jgi:hypothetical protein